MFTRTFLIAVAVVCLPTITLAVGPGGKKQQKALKQQAKHGNNNFSPSMSGGRGNANDIRNSARRNNLNVNKPSLVDARSNQFNRQNNQFNRNTTNINRPTTNINRPTVNVNRPTRIDNTRIDNTLINNSGNRVANINSGNRINNGVINNTNTTVVNNNYNYGNQQINNNRRRSNNNNYYYNRLYANSSWRPNGWNGYRPVYANYYGGYGGGYSSYAVSGGLAVGSVQVGFTNPFYVAPTTTTVVSSGLNYSQPIHVPPPDYQETNDDLVKSEQAVRRFDDAREFFRQGNYARANTLVDEAIGLLPSDPTLHQFRSLVLFAQGKYQDAAAAAYSVLAVDSGWNRDTLAQLYDDPKEYERQFQALQRFAAANPTATDARFLLAYHYMMLGDIPSATKNLEVVRIARPSDKVTLNLLAAMKS